ncbi:MAG: thiamine phosphate synthase [Puniceicoccales bacterium]|jgi:thiamine-phosphate pyrophosphorylase|nr:thiamine phosphate synthase [Puniceicoccales bacterium]
MPDLPESLSLYLVTDAPDRCRLGLLDTVVAAVEGGVSLVQYRTVHAHKGAAYAEAQALRALLAVRRVPLLVNDHIDLALAVDADGAHIGRRDLPPQAARRLLGPGRWLGLSTNNLRQLEATDFSLLDYIGIGPIFPTGTKRDVSPVVGVEKLACLVARSPCPVVAIGGITLGVAASVRAAGVAGLAVASAICGAVNPAAAARALRRVG